MLQSFCLNKELLLPYSPTSLPLTFALNFTIYGRIKKAGKKI